jgi:hypothetical protein
MARFVKKLTLICAIAVTSLSNSGCAPLGSFLLLWDGVFTTAWDLSQFWWSTPLIPVPSVWSQQIEDAYHEAERYDKIPVLDPVEGENAPLFCLDPPSDDEVVRALPDDTRGGVAFLAETSRNNVRITVDLIVDRVDECKFYPLVGPARLHHCHYKCTVYFDKTIRSSWPVPFTHTDETKEVVYIDHDHLIRCAGPATGEYE